LLEKKSEIGGFEYELQMDEKIPWVQLEENIKVNLIRIA